MANTPHNDFPCATYFVDEAGDGVIFDRKGRILLGETTPRYFMLGMTRTIHDKENENALSQLRSEILSAPLYAGIPSLKSSTKKTARFFHAKDDHPEIRAKVFELITTLDFQFYAVIKDMQTVLSYVQSRNEMETHYRYQPNELYDNQLNKEHCYTITFARRGKSDRSKALLQQLKLAQQWSDGSDSDAPNLSITPHYPWEAPCLQIADYCLWALQRSYEKEESRFLKAIWSKVSLIIDIDDPASDEKGAYLTSKSAIPQGTKNRKI